MKDYRVLFAAVTLGVAILMIGIFTVSVFNYISFLKEQHYSLLGIITHSIAKLRMSVMNLESEQTIKQLVVLRLENLALKKETAQLADELARLQDRLGVIETQARFVLQNQETVDEEPEPLRVIVKKDSPALPRGGNQGYLFREGQ